MNVETIKDDFRRRISEQIDLEPQGQDRYQVVTPFRFDDGDHFVITLRREGEGWVFTDEASTIMHLSYWETDALETGNRKEIIDSSLSVFSVQNREGELVIRVPEERFGDALFDFVQALGKVADISFLSRERVRSTFMEDLAELVKSKVPPERLSINWRHENDQSGKYCVDFLINHMKRPLLIFGLPNEERASVATISLLRLQKWGMNFQSMGVFEEQETIHPKVVARLTDAVDKAFSSLHDNRDAITMHLARALEG